MSGLKQKLIAKIHTLKNKAKLDDDVYRLILLRTTGKESCKGMSIAELEAVLTDFSNRGLNNKPYYKPTVSKSKFEYVETKCSKMKKIFKLWNELAEMGAIRNSYNEGLNSFLQHKFNCNYEKLNNTNPNLNTTKDKIIEGLNRWYRRSVKKVIN